jgi:hypothetical protein
LDEAALRKEVEGGIESAETAVGNPRIAGRVQRRRIETGDDSTLAFAVAFQDGAPELGLP